MKTSQFTPLIRHWVEARLRGKQGNGSARALTVLLEALIPKPPKSDDEEEEYGDETSGYGGWPAPW